MAAYPATAATIAPGDPPGSARRASRAAARNSTGANTTTSAASTTARIITQGIRHHSHCGLSTAGVGSQPEPVEPDGDEHHRGHMP